MRPKLKQKLHHHEERKRANDSSSKEEVTVDDEARPLLPPTRSVVMFSNPRLPNITDAVKAELPKFVTFTELREPLDLIYTNDS